MYYGMHGQKVPAVLRGSRRGRRYLKPCVAETAQRHAYVSICISIYKCLYISIYMYYGMHGQKGTCCAERVETWPMLLEIMRSRDSAPQCVYRIV